MTEAIKRTLRDSKTARWIALAIVSFTMFTGYLFTEIISPLKPKLESIMGWDSSDFGVVTSAYGWFNVFLLMLIIGGIILDKMGIRFSAVSSAMIMIIGAFIKYWAINTTFSSDVTILGMNLQIIYASLGYAIFGVGVEIAGITVSKVIVKWFKGKEMALAMGLEMATARLGSFVAMLFAPFIAEAINVPITFLFGVLLLVIGLLTFIIYIFMDIKLDKELADVNDGNADDEDFQLKDIGNIISNRGFWYIAILCVLFYSAVFPFYKYGPDLMVNKYGVSERWAGLIPSLVPLGTMILTPFFGNLYDRKGKGATIMIYGAVMLILVHFTLFIPALNSVYVAAVAVIVLGIAFSLVPSAMWPSVPKIIPEKQLGTAFALIFWVQNWGLMGVPFILGIVLEKTNPGVSEAKQAGEAVNYDYTTTWLIFVGLTLLALLFAFLLKAEDKKKGYGLELPNIQK